MLRKSYLHFLAVLWEISLIILKLYFEKLRERFFHFRTFVSKFYSWYSKSHIGLADSKLITHHVYDGFKGWSSFLPFLRECNSVKWKVIFLLKNNMAFHLLWVFLIIKMLNAARLKKSTLIETTSVALHITLWWLPKISKKRMGLYVNSHLNLLKT